MKGFTFLGALGVASLAAVLVSLPTPSKGRPVVVREGHPTQAMMFRAQQRQWPLRTQEVNPMMRALAQRKAMIGRQSYSAGVSPASWVSVGPLNVGGRIRAVAIDPTNGNTIYIGAASGGIWKTTDLGVTWTPLNDFLPSLSVSCIYFKPGDTTTLYAGTGEGGFWETPDGSMNTANVRGAGIWKSTDSGATWNQIPSTSSSAWYSVCRIAFSPTNPNIMLAGTSAGTYRSADGGNSWTQVTAEHTYDIDFHPTDGSRAVIGVHDDGVFYTLDAGLTWTHATGITGHRTELAYAVSSPTTIYATVSTSSNTIQVWKSTNGGVSFALQAAPTVGTYEAYNNALWVDPTNANNLMYGGVNLYRSTNGGASRTQVFNAIHSDHHIILAVPGFNGSTNRTLIYGGDGGLYRTADYQGTASNKISGNLGITQFYGASINPVSGRILGGTQDNYTQLYSGNASGWTQTFGGDGGFTATDPADQNYFYGTVYTALHFRSTNGGTSASYIYNTANPITDANTANVNFENYLMLDPNNSSRLFSCCKRLWRTNNSKAGAPDWFVIKPAIAPRPGGGGSDVPEAHFNPNDPLNISMMAIAPGNSDIIWVGHNNGQVWKSVNGTATSPTWTRMDTNGPLPARWVGKILVHPTNANIVYVTFMGYEANNVWRTTNGGTTWSQVTGLPAMPVSAFAIHPTMTNWLYAGGDLGIFTSSNGGTTWTTNNQGANNAPVEELIWRNPQTLMAVTHGRGIWLATLNPPEERFSPESFSMPFGTLQAPSEFWNCLTSDDRKLDAVPTFLGSRSDAPIQFEFTATSPSLTATSLSMSTETRVDLTGMDVALAMFNWGTGQWEELIRQPATATDSGQSVTVSAAPARFIGVGGAVKGRVRFYTPNTAPRVVHGFVDLLYWKVTP
ncbi:MAG: hypothetical protein ABL962_01850 [Fimbriimonadaceae bacterium]